MNGFNPAVSLAIARRQLMSFLGNPVGYIFILGFVVASGCVAFIPDDFWNRSVADFGVLYQSMPWILMVVLPALAMSAWSSEREHGTEELLLTMPVTVIDAVVGKYLAIVGFFTLALVCNVSNVAALIWLGNPDLGQVLANHLGWWGLGLGYTAMALLGSVLVASSAIAFVLGALLCGAYALLVVWFDLLEPFNRGLFSLDLFLMSAAATVAALGAACLSLSSNRWHPERAGNVVLQVVALVLAVITAVNVGRIAQRSGMQHDLSAAHISSLTATSKKLIQAFEFPAEVVVVISDDSVLPESLQARAQELRSKAFALERASGGRIAVSELRPIDAFDPQGRRASETYGIEARPATAETVVGPEQVDVFLGAILSCGPETHTIPYFDPGLSVEYELVRSLRTVMAKAVVRPPVTVDVYVAEDVPEPAQARADAVLAWAEEQKLSNATVSVQRVAADQLATIADQHGLDLEMVALPAVEEPAAETEGDAQSDAQTDADQTPGAQADDSVAEAEPAAQPAPQPVVLGAVVSGPQFTARVASFEDPAGVDGDIRGALRRARRPLPVLGVLSTGLQLNGGFDASNPMGGQIPEWGIVGEWSKQYTVREVNPSDLDPTRLDDVDVLIVAQPSSLAPEDADKLTDWIWHGRPTLVFSDSLPFFHLQGGQNFAAAAPAQAPPPSMPGMPPSPPPPKAGVEKMRPLFEALGLELGLNMVLWSQYTPSVVFTSIPKEFVWVDRVNGAFGADDQTTKGVESMIFVGPAPIRVLDTATTTIKPLVTLGGNEQWDTNGWSTYTRQDQFGRTRLDLPSQYRESAMKDTTLPHLAVQVSGTMAHPGTSLPSTNAVNVVVVSDVDMIHDGIFSIYRNVPTGPDAEEYPPELTKLRNVQFVENAIDLLAGSSDLIALRADRPARRSLERMEAKRSDFRQEAVETADFARRNAEDAKNEEQDKLNVKLNEIMARTDIDSDRKRNEREYLQRQAQQRLNIRTYQIDQEAEATVRSANAKYRSEVLNARRQMQAWVIAVPALVLMALVGLVTAMRIAGERMDIPTSRDRRNA